MKKILSINEHPLMHGYFHTASFMSIATNRVRFNLSDVSISDMKWIYQRKVTNCFWCDEKNAEGDTISVQKTPNGVVISDDKIDFYFDVHSSSDSFYLYQPLKNVDEFSFKLNAIKEAYRWSFAGIDISELDAKKNYTYFRAAFEPLDKIRIAWNCGGSDFCLDLDNHHQHCYLKIEVTKMLTVLTSFDGINWEKIYEKENLFDASIAHIGFSTWMGNDCFKDWLFTNFIQLHCSKDLSCYYDVKLNYYIGDLHNNRYHDSNPWLNKFYIPRSYIKGKDVINLIKYALLKGQYVTLELNERYVPNTWAYENVSFEHENLIYGIDEQAQVIYLMGYDKHQIFSPYTLSYSEFLDAFNHVTCDGEITLLSFEIPQLPLTLNKATILTFCKEYLSGTNSTYREILTHDCIDWVFGIQIYDVLLQNVSLLGDKKIVYLLYEHKHLMKERVKYLSEKGLIDALEYDILYNEAENLEKTSTLLLMKCIKYKKRTSLNMEENICNTIMQLKERDIAFMTYLIQCLHTDAS